MGKTTEGRTTIRPAVKWHGGKRYLWRWIVDHFPPGYESMTYVEPFGGMASVLLNKQPSQVEVFNDVDAEVFNLFTVLRKHQDEFLRALTLTPYHELAFKSGSSGTGPVERAVAFYVRCRQTLGGRGDTFSETRHRSRRDMADVVSGWLSSIDTNLPLVIDRLRCVQFVCRDAVKVIRKWDKREKPGTLFYCDPPYLSETRTSPDVYGHEMTDVDHRKLLDVLGGIEGRMILSGYRNDMYDEAAARFGWRRVEHDAPNHAAGGKAKRRMTECLWMNYSRTEP